MSDVANLDAATSAGASDVLKTTQQYFEAWNRRDPAAVAACFGEGGTYRDPTTGGALEGEAITAYASALWAAFPDLTFELSRASCEGSLVSTQWVMRGTNTGSFFALSPTGRSVEVRGADFFVIEGGAIQSVEGYFDSRAVPSQLGLDVIVQPHAIGPFEFGTSVRVASGKRTQPGVFSITMLDVRSDDEAQQVKDYSRQTAIAMLGMPGFLGFTGATVGSRMITVTAWEDEGSPARLRTDPAHREAMAKFFGSDIGSSGFVSTWVPRYVAPMRVRCESCGAMAAVQSNEMRCHCGARLPEPPPYF